MAQEFTEADLLADVSQQRHRASPTTTTTGRSPRTASPTYRLRGRRARRAAAQLLARRVARVAERARRSPATTASKAGARSASGRGAARRAARRRRSRSRRRASWSSTAPIRWKSDGTSLYYESIDLDDAFHPQTILAYELNDAAAADRQRRADPAAGRAAARLQAREVRDADRARRELRHDRRRQGRLLGGPGLPVVRRDLIGGYPKKATRPVSLSVSAPARRCERPWMAKRIEGSVR